MSVFAPAAERTDALRTDLYQITMAAAMFQARLDHHATFELFTRSLNSERGFWVAAGLELALEYLEGLRFTQPQLDYLATLPGFARHSEFLAYLADFRFTGAVRAVAEGTPVFPWEPLLQVSGPAIEVQLVETYLLSLVNFQTLIASKAARVDLASRNKSFVDFGTRRAHGPEAGELVARAAYLAGASGTSNVEAGLRLGIPVLGTFAHSWVMSFAHEDEAFRRYAEAFPGQTTLLIDTYDTLAAAKRIVSQGLDCRAVRLDSGALGELSKQVREIFEAGGRPEIKIVASNDLNELKIEALEEAGCAIDVYGVGTELATSKDMPALGGVYKVVETQRGAETRYPIKLSASKRSWPGAKQIYRLDEGRPSQRDELCLASEPAPAGGRALLEPVMRAGRRTRPAPALAELRAACQAQVANLPEPVRRLRGPGPYTMTRSPALVALAERAHAEARERGAGAARSEP